jgi:hypothetical protein
VFEVFGQHFFGESILVDNDEADAIGSPLHNFLISMILSDIITTFKS